VTEEDRTQLQRRHGGRYVACRDGEVVASAETYDELSDQLDAAAIEWSRVVIEYVEPTNRVGAY
jgi:hypothetical protein